MGPHLQRQTTLLVHGTPQQTRHNTRADRAGVLLSALGHNFIRKIIQNGRALAVFVNRPQVDR